MAEADSVASGAAVAPPRRAGWPWIALSVLALFGVFFQLYRSCPVLYDADAYYHLAVARLYAEQGIVERLPWLRFSLLGDGFGDKELLFHVLLAPLASLLDPLAGGRLALALLDALALGTVGALAVRAIGPWGCLVPLWLVVASTELTWRLVRLRPELLSLTLLLAAIWAFADRRDRWLGVLGAVYALSYTAVHAFFGLVCLMFLAFGWLRRRWEWRAVLYAALGCGAGLVVHPQFPNNLTIWVVQNVWFFAEKTHLEVGTEILPNTTDVTLMANLGWFLVVTVLVLASRQGDEPGSDERLADGLAVASLVFALLYLLMSRFSLYLFPLATLWILFELRRRGRPITRWVRIGGRRLLPTPVALGICLLVSLPVASRELGRFAARTRPGPENARLVDRERVGRALPDGAQVAAPWKTTPIYLLWAPQGRYLNTLDPIFMATPFPEAFEAQRRIFAGEEPDVPLALVTRLASDYLAFSLADDPGRLAARLDGDPRVEPLYQGFHGVFRVVAHANQAFVLDWVQVPANRPLPLAAGQEIDGWEPYPRSSNAVGRAVEGFVDASRIGARTACAALVHRFRVEAGPDLRIEYQLAPSGAATLWLDEELLVATASDLDAVLSRGLALSARVASGEHRLQVAVCPPRDRRQPAGFYLRELARTAVE